MKLYERLEKEFGEQEWWPADSRFEVIVGAILTQNVSWKNVENAIANLKREGVLSPSSVLSIEDEKLHELIKPTGFYRQKGERLKRISKEILEYENLEDFLDQEDLRNELLEVKGIGPETADSIVLYSAEIPSFVIDAYTKRIMDRIFEVGGNYQELRSLFEDELEEDLHIYQEYHALLVELAKRYCKKNDPLCSDCPVKTLCSEG